VPFAPPERAWHAHSLQGGPYVVRYCPVGSRRAGVDLTESLYILVAGLVGLVWLSAGLIVVMTMHHYWSQSQARLPAIPASPDHKEAA
jgi:hypothetical protein